MQEKDFTGTIFAGCKIIKKIGQGGMGTVYTAHHEALDKVVCVKLLSPELARDQRNIEFFLREARSAAKLEHPNIVHVYNFGQENDSYFIVMSFVEGKSLQELVEQKGPLPVAEATELIAGILDGLGHAHSKSIVHRDIKPSNILVDTTGRPHIVDFGLARSITEEKQLTMAGEMIGTAYFMSPEQCLASPVDHRADLYAVGATYFYILTGKYPFDGKTSVEVIHKHIGEPAPSPMLVNPEVPLWAGRIVERLMRKKAEERYQKAEDVATELRKYNSGELKIGQRKDEERTYEMPELTSRLMSMAPPPPPPPQNTRPASKGGLEFTGNLPPQDTTPPQQQPDQESKTEGNPKKSSVRKGAKLQLPMLHNSLKTLNHAAVTVASAGCFLVAGAAGGAEAGASLSGPLSTNPALAVSSIALGLVLAGWAIWMKPSRFSLLHALFLLAGAAAAFAAGALVPVPQGADAATKAFQAVSLMLQGNPSQAGLLVYSFFLYLLGSKLIYRSGWTPKFSAIVCLLAGLAMTYHYFKLPAPAEPDPNWLAAAGALAAVGLVSALSGSKAALFLNPPIFFLASNLAVFAMFSTSAINISSREKLSEEEESVAMTNSERREAYRRTVEDAKGKVEYDVEGRQLEIPLPPKPEELTVSDISVHQARAKQEYYGQTAARVNSSLTDYAGLLLLALLLALMANICFIEELIAVYKGEELFY